MARIRNCITRSFSRGSWYLIKKKEVILPIFLLFKNKYYHCMYKFYLFLLYSFFTSKLRFFLPVSY